MPASDGKLTNEETSEIIDYLNKNWSNDGKCPFCGSDEWEVFETMFVCQVVAGQRVLANKGYHFIGLQSKCGFIAHLDPNVVWPEYNKDGVSDDNE